MSVRDRLAELGLTLPPPPTPAANYVTAVAAGRLVFLAGHTPPRDMDGPSRGKLTADLTVEQGYAAARMATLNALSSLGALIGDLERVRRVVQVQCIVNSAPDFTQQPQVANGASDLLAEVFGERGVHCRSAFGVPALPGNACVELMFIAEVQPGG